jgi:hypothetical protein
LICGFFLAIACRDAKPAVALVPFLKRTRTAFGPGRGTSNTLRAMGGINA